MLTNDIFISDVANGNLVSESESECVSDEWDAVSCLLVQIYSSLIRIDLLFMRKNFRLAPSSGDLKKTQNEKKRFSPIRNTFSINFPLFLSFFFPQVRIFASKKMFLWHTGEIVSKNVLVWSEFQPIHFHLKEWEGHLLPTIRCATL